RTRGPRSVPPARGTGGSGGADAVVADGDEHRTGFCFGAAVPLTGALGAILDGVAAQVRQEAAQPSPVGADRGRVRALDPGAGSSVGVRGGGRCQEGAGGLWDVLTMLRLAVGRGAGGPEVRFAIHVRDDNREGIPPLVWLKVFCGPGDDSEP